MADTKQTKTIGEHHVAAELARRGWAPALTRDGLERTDILAVLADGTGRRLIEIQVKTARGPKMDSISWPLGPKSQAPSMHDDEFIVMVAVPHDEHLQPRIFIVPRIHVAAAAWIEHMDWLTQVGVPAGQRNATVDRARVSLATFKDYENRWDLLKGGQRAASVLLPREYRALAMSDRVGLLPKHEWRRRIPEW